MGFRVCLVSDFFYPNAGGVESHLFQLAQCLMERGHRVIIITHAYGNRTGIRFMTNGLKVYYLPIVPFYNKSVLPTIVGSLPYLRRIIKSENIQIIHGHSAFSTLAHEALFVGAILDRYTVFTDHSLFGFADASAVVTNTFLKFSLANTHHCVCVSHTGKENTVLRSEVPKSKVSVIPNAVDSATFHPNYERPSPQQLIKSCDLRNGIKGGKIGKVVVIIGSRLVYRKGIDLVVALVPRVCAKTFKSSNTRDLKTEFQVDFMIGGDGPKRILFEEMIEEHNLQNRVQMLGELCHSDMRDKLLSKGDIFLNTSLTEAFCMAILEATSCGLSVVSTKVGGIPEVLPERFIYFVEPDVQSIQSGLERAVQDVIDGKRPDKSECHEFVKNAYNWRTVAKRTEIVYETISAQPHSKLERKVRNLWEKGRFAGPMMAVLFLFCHYWILLLDRFSPV